MFKTIAAKITSEEVIKDLGKFDIDTQTANAILESGSAANNAYRKRHSRQPETKTVAQNQTMDVNSRMQRIRDAVFVEHPDLEVTISVPGEHPREYELDCCLPVVHIKRELDGLLLHLYPTKTTGIPGGWTIRQRT